MTTSEKFKGPEARFAFAQDLFKPKDNNGKLQYQATLLYPKGTDLSAYIDAIKQVAVEEWGDKAIQWLKDELIKNPILDGDGKQGLSKKTGERYEGYAGCNFIRVQSGVDYKPTIVDENIIEIVNQKNFKSGDYGYPVVNAFTWENEANGKGVSFSISMVQKSRSGDSLGGGGSGDPKDFFQKIKSEEAPAETKNGDGAKSLFS
jgi:hypothetical protein